MESAIKPKAPISILLVEDEVTTLGILANVLTKKFQFFPLYTADNGRSALELFKVHLPEIVITDINMPEMTGVPSSAT
jgi:two-component system, NarL family, response regulator DesR